MQEHEIRDYLKVLVTADKRRQSIIQHDGRIKGVLVCCPTYGGHATQQTLGTLFVAGQMLGLAGIPSQLSCLSFSDVVDVRNVQLTKFYDDHPELSHCLMIDNDMGAEHTLIKGMLELNKPLVGTLYARREFPDDGDIRSIMIGHLLPENETKFNGGFMKVRHVGGGILLFTRDLVTEMLKKHPEINDLDDPGRLEGLGVTRVIRAFEKMRGPEGNRLSEDYSFCERWQQCGGEVWANYAEPVSHVGPYDFKPQYYEMFKPKVQAAA